MLNSCAPGVTVVNIDNGYGAGVFAARVAATAARLDERDRLDRRLRRRERRHAARRPASAPGCPLGVLARAPSTRSLPSRSTLRPEQVARNGFAATRCHVEVADSAHHRTWRDIRALLGAADLDEDVRELAARTSSSGWPRRRRACTAPTPLDVHFHEVGALDAIADVVGVCAGFVRTSALRAHGRASAAGVAVAVGAGTVRGAHGQLPVPPPGGRRAAPRRARRCAGPGRAPSSCTPTGAALLTTLADAWGPQPAMTVDRRSASAPAAATRRRHANVLRLLRRHRAGAATDRRAEAAAASRPTSTTSTRGCGRR